MNLDRIAAEAFLEELHKIAAAGVDEGTKTAAMTMLDNMDVELVEQFLKEAGLGGLIAGVGRGIGGLASGAARGAGAMAAGVGRGVAGAARNAVGNAVQGVQNMGQSIKGSLQAAGSAAKAAPGAIGQRMTAMGQGVQNKLTAMGNNMAAAGANKGQAIQGRLAGPGAANPMKDIQTFQRANAGAAAPTGADSRQALSKIDDIQNGGAPKVPMMGAGQLAGEYNPFHGMISSAVQGVRGMLQPPGPPAQRGAMFGTVAPAQ